MPYSLLLVLSFLAHSPQSDPNDLIKYPDPTQSLRVLLNVNLSPNQGTAHNSVILSVVSGVAIPTMLWSLVPDLFGHHLTLSLGQMNPMIPAALPFHSGSPSPVSSRPMQMKSLTACYQVLVVDPCILTIMVVVLIKKVILNKLH